MKKQRGIFLSETICKSIVAGMEPDQAVLRFIQSQGDCVASTINATVASGERNAADLEAMARSIADVWIMSSLMFYVFPKLGLPEHVDERLAALVAGAHIPDGEHH